jgi:hypothetical protein
MQKKCVENMIPSDSKACFHSYYKRCVYIMVLFPNSSKNAISGRGFLSLGKYAFCLKLSGILDEYPDIL